MADIPDNRFDDLRADHLAEEVREVADLNRRIADLKAKVARLEAAIAAKDAALEGLLPPDEPCPVCRVCLDHQLWVKKAIEQAHAALSPDAGKGTCSIGLPRREHCAECGVRADMGHLPDCGHKTGEGWLPPEVAEQAARAIRGLLPMNVAGNCFYCDLGVPFDEDGQHASSQFPDGHDCLNSERYESERAALDALKGVE